MKRNKKSSRDIRTGNELLPKSLIIYIHFIFHCDKCQFARIMYIDFFPLFYEDLKDKKKSGIGVRTRNKLLPNMLFLK